MAAMSQAEQILAALGGRSNIVELEACITRLRTEALVTIAAPARILGALRRFAHFVGLPR